MSLTENQPAPRSADRPSSLLEWIDGEIERVAAQIPALDEEGLRAAEDLAEADVIRRHVILHPERFSPHERDGAVEKAQRFGVARERAEIESESVRDRLRFCQAMAPALRPVRAPRPSWSPRRRPRGSRACCRR